MLFVSVFAFAFVACGGKTESTEAETEATEEPMEEPAADTTMMETDTTATDTTASE